MSEPGTTEYVELKRSIYREYSSSRDEYRQRFVNAETLARHTYWNLNTFRAGHRLLDLGPLSRIPNIEPDTRN